MKDEVEVGDGAVTMCQRKDTAHVDLWYPNQRQIQFIEIGLMDVRASDGMRIHYDFYRDGWVIEQASKWEWGVGEIPDSGWKETAFIQSWALEEGGKCE